MRFGQWVAKQIDGGVTVVGALIILGLLGSCLGAIFSFISGSLILATIFGAVLIVLFLLLYVAARATDTTISMSANERQAVWKRLPAFARQSLLTFLAGNVAGSLLLLTDSSRLGHLVSWVAIGASMLVLAEGIRTQRPALPQSKGELLTSGSAGYGRLWKQTLIGSYVASIISFVIATIAVIR